VAETRFVRLMERVLIDSCCMCVSGRSIYDVSYISYLQLVPQITKPVEVVAVVHASAVAELLLFVGSDRSVHM